MKAIIILFLISAFASSSLSAQQADEPDRPDYFTNELGMEFLLIDPGSMVVGRVDLKCPTSPDTRDVEEQIKWTDEDYRLCEELAKRDSRPGFTITIQEPYYIGIYEITQEQWKKVMGENPSFFQGTRIKGDTSNHPVDNITWEQAQTFLNKLNQMDPASTYRLPTEFEWEFAARAGNNELLSWAETKEQAWIQDINKGSHQPVGQMKPNPWGLYDTLGNVWEWVEDYYNDRFFPGPIPPDTGEVHVLRGGSFLSDVTNATYFFHGAGPGNGYDVGLRIVREVK